MIINISKVACCARFLSERVCEILTDVQAECQSVRKASCFFNPYAVRLVAGVDFERACRELCDSGGLHKMRDWDWD